MPNQIMSYNAYTLVVAPLLGWLVTVSVLIVAYLASLVWQERRHNRRMDQERHRLGLL